MIGKAIYSLLSNDTDVAALVGTNIYPSLAIEDVDVDYIVYEEDSRAFNDSKDGKSCVDVLSYNIELYTDSLEKANDLGLKVRNVLDRYSGTVEGLEIQSVQFTAEDIDYTDSPNRVYLKMQNYSFRYVTIYSTLARIIDLAGTSSSTTQNDLTWSDVAPTATGYEVWRSTDLEGWTLINTTAANATSYADTGLTAETQYYYRVRPTDGTNGGEWSNIIGIRTDNGTVSQSGIAYDRPILTGQTTSYTTGDDGWNYQNGVYDYTPPAYPVSYAALDTFTTLIDNNAFGNLNRFTALDGTGTITSNYTIDHLTGLGIIVVPRTAATWANAHSLTNALTLVGFSDWRVMNMAETEVLFNRELSTRWLNYAPFNLSGAARTYSSTTYSISTTNAMEHLNLFFTIRSKTQSDVYIICRNHYS